MGKILSLVLGNFRSLIPLILMILVVGYYNIKITKIEKDYEKQIKERVTRIDTLNNKVILLNSELLEKNKIITTHELSIQNLLTSVEKTKVELENIRVDNKNLQAKLNNWANNPIEKEVIKYIDKIIYVKDKNNVTCKDYEDINKRISKMRYEDL